MKFVPLIIALASGMMATYFYVRKAAVRASVCKAMSFLSKVICLVVIPFLFLATWLYEPLWSQICLLLNIGKDDADIYKVHVWWVLLLFTTVIVHGWCIIILKRKKCFTPKSSSAYRKTVAPKDAPIHKWAEDLLRRRPFVEVLKTAIMRADVQNDAEYIGIFGDWGAGKTSVMNLLKSDMKADKSAIFVDFDPWDSRSADDAVDSFMRVIADVALRNGAFAVADSFSDYLQALRLRKTDVDYGSIGLILEFLRWKFYYVFLNSRRDKLLLKRHLRLMSRRIVVILDDLERMPQEDVSEILRTIKTNLNLPNLVFLIVSSKRHLLKAAAHYLGESGVRDEGDEKECLLKIVQYQFSLPAVPKSDIMAFFKTKLSQVLKECGYSYGDYNIETDNDDGYETANEYIHTLRSALLLSNSVWEALAYLRKLSPDGTLNVHIGDLVALSAIRLIDEKFYNAIPELYSVFIRAYTNRFLLGYQGLQENEFDSWMQRNTIESHRDCDMEFLEKRMGLVKSQDKNGTNIYSLKGLSGSRQEMLSEYRLGSPECFKEYFFDFASTRHVSKEMMMDFVSRIEDGKSVEEIFQNARKRNELPNLILSLEGVSQFSSDIATVHYFKQLFNLATISFNNDEYIYQGLDGFVENIYTAIWRCVVRYCAKYRQQEGFSNTFSNIVYAGRLLWGVINEIPEPHLVWRWLSYEYGNYEKDKQLLRSYKDIMPDLISQSSLFSSGQYESLQVIYLDTIEKYQEKHRLFVDKECFDLMKAWNICLLAKDDRYRYETFQSLLGDSLGSISNVLKLIVFITKSEVRFGDALEMKNGIRFLPIDCSGALRLFGERLLNRISDTFSSNYDSLSLSQKATAKALKYVIENKFDPNACDDDHQISFIREWVRKDKPI